MIQNPRLVGPGRTLPHLRGPGCDDAPPGHEMEDRTRERHTGLLGGWNLPCFNVAALKNKRVLEDAVGLFNKRRAGAGF